MNINKTGMEDGFCKVFEKPWKNPVDDRHVGYQLKMLDQIFCKEMVKLFREDGYDGVTMLGGWILEYLAFQEEEVIYQKDIERNFKVGKSTIAGIMKVLEKNDLIVRKSVKGDARLKQVCLTKKGEQYIEQMRQRRNAMEERVTKGLSQKELDLFFQIVKKMRENLLE
ncbi:MAG: hypothetical protein K2L07_10840 [Lachnospiraceae bacterium]|nr:hypothetical protein [Lachnospiraceae bacterium]